MQTAISFFQAITISSTKKFNSFSATVKSVANNETYQKAFLFAGILGLLLLAANLEKFV